MDASQTGQVDIPYSNPAPLLVAGTTVEAIARAVPMIEASGLRVGDRVLVGDAAARIERQASASAVWLELDHDCGGAMDALLGQVRRDVAAGRYAAVVSATAALLDPLAATLADSAVELIVDATDAERASALAIATTAAGMPLRVADVASDHNAARLRQLSAEVSRIASTLARLSSGPAPLPAAAEIPRRTEAPAISADIVRSVIRARRLRARFFAEDLFADPAWDMLLDLLQAEITQLRVPVSSLCIAAAVPATTALRWLKTMVQQGIFVRRADPHDGRRVFVELAPQASDSLRRYFAEVGQVVI